jgi:EAL domain-containing protein (putative c-di-GMP-specific phosphodiesterase class I)
MDFFTIHIPDVLSIFPRKLTIFVVLKIDQVFITLLPEDTHFVKGLIGLPHPSGIKVVADGVETSTGTVR